MFGSGEMLNYPPNAQQGFHPRTLVAPPLHYTPNRYYVIIAQCRSGMGGQAHVPSFIVPLFVVHI